MSPIKNKFKTFKFGFATDNSGATMVEFAMVVNLFLGLIFAIILWGVWLWESNTIQHATMQAARCSILPDPGSGKLCVDTNTYGKLNAIGLTPASATTAGQEFTQVSQNGTIAGYSCVTASYNSGLFSLFYFKDNSINWQICYIVP